MNLILLEKLLKIRIHSIFLLIIIKGILSDNENFQFWNEIIRIQIPPLKSINVFLENTLFPTSIPQCKINVFDKYSDILINKDKTTCKGTSKTQQQNNWEMIIIEKEKSSYVTVKIQNLNKSALSTIEYVIVNCCLFTENKKSETAHFLLVAIPTNFYVFDVNNLTDNERQYKQPHFLETSSCPCDLSENHCDIFCCCDLECPFSAYESFNCIKGSYDGHKTEILNDWKCKNIQTEIYFEFHPMLCIFSENTPFLGYFFQDISKANDHSSISKILSNTRFLETGQFKFEQNQKKSKYIRKLSRKYFLQISKNFTAPLTSYNSGDKLQVVTVIHEIQRFTELFIPIALYSGFCTFQFPVRFLQNYQSLCKLNIKQMCKENQMANTMLDANYFVKNGHEILQIPGSNETLKPNIKYLHKKYSLFNDTFQYEILDSYSSPVYFNGNCQNIVHEVEYKLFWNGGRLLMINITITVNDICLEKGKCGNKFSDSNLSQKLSVKFLYKMNNTSIFNKEENLTNEKHLEYRSGNPGYEIGYPILSAIVYENDDYFIQLGNYMKLWNPSTDGDCLSSTHSQILFGHNSFSGCAFTVNSQHLEDNCTLLKSDLMNLFKDLVQAQYISKGGNPNLKNISDFIKVTSDNSSDNLLTETSETCYDLPYHHHIEIAYTESERLNDRSVLMIVNSFVKYYTKSWTPYCSMEECYSQKIIFPLTSDVNFVRIPSKKKKTKRFWDYGEIEYCNREICFEEMFFPFTDSFQSDLIFHVSFWSIMILLFLLPLLWLTRRQFY